MEKNSQFALLSAIIIFLWVWQGSQPVFDKSLPFLNISDSGLYLRSAPKENERLHSGTILVSVSEIIALYLGVATMASVYSLYWVCSDGKATFWQNMAFSVLASLTSSGYGMHAACVVAQLQMAPDNRLYSLLDFVHERWSHYMFQCGIFSLLLLIVWVERPDPSLSTSQAHREESKKLPLLVGVWLKWLGPILVGLFTAIFSNRTETGGICLTFYISVIVSCFLFNRYYSFNFLDVLFGKSKYVALSFFVTASLYGVPTVFIHSWLM